MLANCAYIGGAVDECEFDACEVLPEEPAPLDLRERDEAIVPQVAAVLKRY